MEEQNVVMEEKLYGNRGKEHWTYFARWGIKMMFKKGLLLKVNF